VSSPTGGDMINPINLVRIDFNTVLEIEF